MDNGWNDVQWLDESAPAPLEGKGVAATPVVSDPVNKTDGWVSVEHETPEPQFWYNVFVERKPEEGESIVTMLFYDSEEIWIDATGERWHKNAVTHWQPIPSPPLKANS